MKAFDILDKMLCEGIEKRSGGYYKSPPLDARKMGVYNDPTRFRENKFCMYCYWYDEGDFGVSVEIENKFSSEECLEVIKMFREKYPPY